MSDTYINHYIIQNTPVGKYNFPNVVQVDFVMDYIDFDEYRSDCELNKLDKSDFNNLKQFIELVLVEPLSYFDKRPLAYGYCIVKFAQEAVISFFISKDDFEKSKDKLYSHYYNSDVLNFEHEFEHGVFFINGKPVSKNFNSKRCEHEKVYHKFINKEQRVRQIM